MVKKGDLFVRRRKGDGLVHSSVEGVGTERVPSVPLGRPPLWKVSPKPCAQLPPLCALMARRKTVKMGQRARLLEDRLGQMYLQGKVPLPVPTRLTRTL